MANVPGRSFLETGLLGDIQYLALQDCINKLGEQYDPGRKALNEWFMGMSNHEVALYLEYMRRNTAQRDLIVYEGMLREVVLPNIIQRLCEGVDMRVYVRRLLSLPVET